MQKRRKIRVAMIIEVKKRELPFFSILQSILQKEGYEVRLIPFRSMCTWRMIKFRPDIVMVNGLRHTYPYYYSQIALPKQWFKAKVICYYSEQVGYYDESLASGYKNQLIFDNVDFHIAWGPRFCRDLEANGVPHEKLWFLGSLQYDIDKYHRQDAITVKQILGQRFGIDANKKWILYADNIIKEYQPKDFYEQRRMDSFNVVKKVAEANPEAIIIFRPHPDTSKAEQKRINEFFSANKNIVFNNQGHLYYWTVSAEALVTWCSTSSIQAMFLNKPIFGFMTSDKQNLERYWYKGILPLYEDYNLLAADVYNCFEGKISVQEAKTREAREKYVEEWYFKKDGLSFNRFVSLFNIVSHADFCPLKGYCSRVKTTTLLRILYYELRAFVGDHLKGRNKDRNVTKREIENEKNAYDIERYEHVEYREIDTKSGKTFEKCLNP